MDPFAVLRIDAGVSEAELSSAYRREAKRWHPDHGQPVRRALGWELLSALGDGEQVLRLRTRTGRRVSFGDLRPEAAAAIAAVLGARGGVTT